MLFCVFFFQAEDGIRDVAVTGVQTCALPILVKDAAGEDAEIIFGTVNDPAMHGEIRVTVIATGFDRDKAAETAGRAAPGVLPFRERVSRPTPTPPAGYVKPAEPARRAAPPPPPDV